MAEAPPKAKKESIFSRKEGDGKKPEPMKNAENPKKEGGEKPVSKDAPASNPHGDMMARHKAERETMHKSHREERRDMHGLHRQAHDDMHGRHQKAHDDLAARQDAEMQAAPPPGSAPPAPMGDTPPAPGTPTSVA